MADQQPTDTEATRNHDTVTGLVSDAEWFKKSLDNFCKAVEKLETTNNSLIKTLTKLEQNVTDARNETAILRGANTVLKDKFNEHEVDNARILSRHDMLIILALGFSGLGAGVNIQALIQRVGGG